MGKIGFIDLGSQCQSCGKAIEKKYILNVVVHSKRKRYLQAWCVSCVAKAQPGSIQVLHEGELNRSGQLIKGR